MTRNDYIALSEVVGESYYKARLDVLTHSPFPFIQSRFDGIDTLFEYLMSELLDTLSRDNPQFNRDRFTDAVATIANRHNTQENA